MKTIAKEILEKIKSKKHVVFYTGAGVSTASGIPDYRSRDGFYNTTEEDVPENLLSLNCLYETPDKFHKFNKQIFDYCKNASPNIIHICMAKMVEDGLVDAIITQNIDNLHGRAFVDENKRKEKLIEFHGNEFIWKCNYCFHKINVTDYPNTICPECNTENGLAPTIVLYGQQIDPTVQLTTSMYSSQADLKIVVGSSLTVYPFADYATGFLDQEMIIINLSETNQDSHANHIYNVNATDLFLEIYNLLLEESSDNNE